MIAYSEVQLSDALRERLDAFEAKVNAFREEGPLDALAVAKLEEHFKASHIYHSAGIEGNRLTLQETLVVLKDGLDISGKPLKDSVEVRHLGAAFDYLKNLSLQSEPVREADIRSLHSLILGKAEKLSPGEYRRSGVIISGAEHRPPEPLDVPPRMGTLVNWINENAKSNPVVVSSLAHHELAAIHPFLDGNGRIARLLMNLILLKRGFPICNISREERPSYYDALSFADVGIYEPLVEIVLSRIGELFGEYERIRSETKRMAEWAKKWGARETEVLLRRESREMELWLSRIRQVYLEFQNRAELLNDHLQDAEVEFYDYKTALTFEQYQQLVERGKISHGNAFSITFTTTERVEHKFMFRFYRNFEKFSPASKAIPLELNYFDRANQRYTRLSDLPLLKDRIRIREAYFSDSGEFFIRYYNIDRREEVERKFETISEAVEWFYDDVLRNILHLH